MKKNNELSYKDLKMKCDPEIFKFEDTSELEAINTGIGQDRGIKALEFGVNVDVRGYILVKRKKIHVIGVIYITLTIQMNQLQFH